MAIFLGLIVCFFIAIFYVTSNLWAAAWLMKRNWKRMAKIYRATRRSHARAFANSAAVVIGGLVAIFLAYALGEIATGKNLWWTGFVIVCVAILPIWAACYALKARIRTGDANRTNANRLGIVITVGFLLWFARAMAISEINSIYPFDPALMPLALTAGVFLTICGLGALPAALFMIVMQVAFIHAVIDRVDHRRKPTAKTYFLLLAPAALFIGVDISVNALSRVGLSDLRTLLIVRIAYEYDFSDHHLCFTSKDGARIPLAKNEKVLFIGVGHLWFRDALPDGQG